jgi:hypothetical protein
MYSLAFHISIPQVIYSFHFDDFGLQTRYVIHTRTTHTASLAHSDHRALYLQNTESLRAVYEVK